VETDLDLSGDAIAAWLEPASMPADATIREPPADPSEFDETIQPSASDWHIARDADAEATIEPAAPTVAMTPRPVEKARPVEKPRPVEEPRPVEKPRMVDEPVAAKPANLARPPIVSKPPPPSPPLPMRTIVLMIVLASAVSGLLGAVLALYFAQGR
jgi:hypothetical protein